MKKILLLIVLLMSIVVYTNITFSQNSAHVIVLAGGNFWYLEADLEKLTGIISVEVGYVDKAIHAVKVSYNPDLISYKQILNAYFRSIDPTDADGSFNERGMQYQPIIFVNNSQQRRIAEDLINLMQHSPYFKKKIVVKIKEIENFYPAEEYYQDFYKKNPFEYSFDRVRSGKDQYIISKWDKIPQEFLLNDNLIKIHIMVDSMLIDKFKDFQKPSDEQLKKILSPLSYDVTQKDATEKPFENEFYTNTRRGIYVDIISGEPLFSSADKYESGSGWSSFKKPIDSHFIIEKNDFSFFMHRIEIRSKYANSHLGHVFDDGPLPLGLRYCVDSAALRFIPYENMEEEGYALLMSQV